MIRTALLTATVIISFAGVSTRPAYAQEPEKPLDAGAMKKQMAEISRLMRESERLLLEMTKADRLVEQQRRIVDELEKLKQPESPSEGTAAEETDANKQKRKQLKQRQSELRQRLEKLFENQEQAANLTEQQLVTLLRNLPKGGQGQMSPSMSPGSEKEGQKPSDEKKSEQKSNDPKQKPETEGDGDSQSSREREEKKKREKEAQLNRYDAWVARLPRAQQERIIRGDFSGFPPRYRRLLREYTRLRAEREVERKRDARPRPR
jgi:hypothetical protein